MIDLRDETVRISEYANENGEIPALRAERVNFVGPAILLPMGVVEMTGNCHVNDGGGGPEAVIWEIDPARSVVVGAIGLGDCTFIDCTFTQIGFAGPHDLVMSLFSQITV